MHSNDDKQSGHLISNEILDLCIVQLNLFIHGAMLYVDLTCIDARFCVKDSPDATMWCENLPAERGQEGGIQKGGNFLNR